MPAYFSIEISFKKDILYSSFVEDVYSVLFQSGFNFKSGYWFGEDMTLEQIIEWNQKHLQNKFSLGYTQHVKYDYKQILLDTDIFSEMRVYWMYSNDRIHLDIIIPESDVLHIEGKHCFFVENKINPILAASCSIWDTGLVSAIQTCLELDDGIDLEEIEQGHLPIINPFCIISNDIAKRFEFSLKSNLTCKYLNKNGVLIVDISLLTE